MFTSTEPNPLLADLDTAIQVVDPRGRGRRPSDAVRAWRAGARRGTRSTAALRRAAPRPRRAPDNLMPAIPGVRPRGRDRRGSGARRLREVFGEYRAPTGVSGRRRRRGRQRGRWRPCARRSRRTGERARRRHLRFLVGKPGLDGHSNGAEQIAVRARDAGFEVVYQGIRLTPAQIVAAAVAEDVARRRAVDPVRLAHGSSCPRCWPGCARPGMTDVPVVVGGIIPDADAAALLDAGRGRGLHAQGLRRHRDHGPRPRRDPCRARPAAGCTGVDA